MEHTFELIKRSQNGEKEATEELIDMHSGLIWSVVRGFTGRGYDKEELYQIGAIGLLKAIARFDFSYEVKFSTYTVPLISGEIKRFLRDDAMIRVSRSLKEKQWKISKAMNRFYEDFGREAKVEELAEELSMEPEEIILAMEAKVEITSLEQKIGTEDGKEMFLIDRISLVENEQETLMDKLFLRQILECLNERERMLIHLRYYENRTQMQVAERMQISQVQVGRLEKKILKKLKAHA